MFADAAMPAAALPETQRTAFLRRTYTHLLLAILVCIGIDAAILTLVPAETLFSIISVFGGWTWMIVLGAFMAVSFVAERMARSATSLPMQYGGLGLYVVAEALILVPLLTIATYSAGGTVLVTAGALTAVIFIALTAYVFITGARMQWLSGVLMVGGLAAMGAIGLSLVFGFTLGIWFTAAMIVFASGSVLYQTSNILHTYHPTQHVAAALGLFASVALLFWYVLRLVMAFRD